MKLKVFHAKDGDCILLTGTQGHNVLIDGGRTGSFEDHARPKLAALRTAGKSLDILCVSHIDADHISGILQLVEDEKEWRVFDFRNQTEPGVHQPPTVARPPDIGQIWHNALFALVGTDLEPQIAGALITAASILGGSGGERAQEVASAYDNLATGEEQSMELSRRISEHQLGIPLNPSANGGLMKRGGAVDVISLGGMNLFVLGPSDDDLQKLRVQWDKWLTDFADKVAALHARMRSDEEDLGTLPASVVANPVLKAALGQGLAGVTAPNLASLMFLAEEGSEKILLTGDGVSSEILDGLAHHGKTAAGGSLHVTALKVQHHAAKANVTEEFVRRVTADNYVFCGNGAHHNPEKEVVEAFANARLAGIGGAGPVGPATPFAFWFSSSSATPGLSPTQKAHMKQLEQVVDTLKTGSGGRMKAKFLDQGSVDVL